MAFDRAVEYAWLEEVKVVSEGRRSQYHWTSSEINELINLGIVKGYGAKARRPLDLYPELADDPSNILFTRSRS